MPGANCAVVGCGTHRRTNKVLSFFKIRQPKYGEWEKALVKAINRSDPSFNKERATICSRHFTPDCFQENKNGRRSLVPGSLPSLWMPQKSVESLKTPPRKSPTERPAPPIPRIVAYYTFDEVRKDAARLPSPWIVLKNNEDNLEVGVLENNAVRLCVKVGNNFRASVSVWGFPLPKFNTCVEEIPMGTFLKSLLSMHVCPGIHDVHLLRYGKLPSGQQTQICFKHVRYEVCHETGTCTAASTIHASKCTWLMHSSELCTHCMYVKNLLLKKHERAEARNSNPLKKNDPLSGLSFEKLKASLKQERKHSRRVQKELGKFKHVLADENRSVRVGRSEMHESLKRVLESDVAKMQPLQKLFWEEQVKAFECGSKTGMRWHPTMIRLAILLHSRSPAAYDTLQKTGVLRLPGESTLRDYTNCSSPQEGFNIEALNNIKQVAKEYDDPHRFVVLLHDEMTIKSDLVFDVRTGELVGFVNSGNTKQLATHVLVFYVVGVNTDLRASMGYFATTAATSQTLFPLFWKAIGLLEKQCKLKVIASVSDKGTPNQGLYDMHSAGGATGGICYKARNIFAREREVFFISDPPHLIKTVRNNLSKSGGRSNTRRLFINGQDILWRHILDVYEIDCTHQLRMTKLTAEHVNLTPASLMNVRLAAQVLSESVGKVLQTCGEEYSETAKFILLFDKFFDCLNVRAKNEGTRKRKPFLQPYSDVKDVRFQFFEDMLQYLDDWRRSVQAAEGKQSEKNKMFLSHQTYKGLVMTLKSFPEAARFLLEHGVEFVLSNRFCQDPLEKHFGRHRGLGRRCDNPSLWAFGYGETKIRQQKSIANILQPRGNVRKADEEIIVSEGPIKKRKLKRN